MVKDKSFYVYMFFLFLLPSLRASSPIWASETSLARTRERAAKPQGAEERFLVPSLARSREARFACLNRRTCSQAISSPPTLTLYTQIPLPILPSLDWLDSKHDGAVRWRYWFQKDQQGCHLFLRYCLSVNFTGHKPLTHLLYLVKRKHEQQVKLLNELRRVILHARAVSSYLLFER